MVVVVVECCGCCGCKGFVAVVVVAMRYGVIKMNTWGLSVMKKVGGFVANRSMKRYKIISQHIMIGNC